MSESRKQTAIQWLLAVLLVAAFAWFSKVFTRDASRLATFWLANGLVLGLMLSAPRARWLGLLCAGWFGNLLGGLLAHDSLVTSIMVSCWNLFEVGVAAWILRSVHETDAAGLADLTRPRFFIRFVIAALIVAPLASGAIVTLHAFIRDGVVSSQRFELWTIAHALGMGIMAPVTLAFQRDELQRLFRLKYIGEKLLAAILLLGVACYVFSQNRYPFLFLMFPPLLLVAIRGGFAATSASILVVALIAVGFTNQGYGPLTLIQGGGMERFLVLELFLAVQMLTMFPVVLMLAERRRARKIARSNELRYRMLADHTNDVIVLADAEGRRVYVSPAVKEVFGWTPEEFLKLNYRETVHPDDIKLLPTQAAPTDDTRVKVTVQYRAKRADDSWIWIESQIVKFRDKHFAELAGLTAGVVQPTDNFEGRVVTLRDITRRKLAEQQLEAANLELASLVWKDGLTGLANRRRFDEFLEQEWQRALRSRQSLAVILLDVDHFKVYNDCYGHQRGDHCLVNVANAIGNGVQRTSDLAARYGGEEFAVVLAGTSLEDAATVAERIRTNLLAARIEHAGSSTGIVSVSIGVCACVPDSRQSDDELVEAADAALYRSKKAGRNRVTSATLQLPEIRRSATN